MAIYTPRGLKVRLPVEYAFALMARLYPQVSAFDVLKTTEGIESLPGALAFIIGLICFSFKLQPLQIGLTTFLVSVLTALMTRQGFYIFPDIIKVGTFYSYLAGFGILIILLAGFGFYLVGWRGVVSFFVARLLAGLVSELLDFRETRRISSISGIAITSSERHFINAYRLHASKLGKPVDASVEDEEMHKENWYPTFMALAMKYPEVVARFTVN